MNKSSKEVKPWIVASYISGAGTVLVLYIVAGYLASKWLVSFFGGSGLWIALGTTLGLILGVANIIVIICRFMGERNG